MKYIEDVEKVAKVLKKTPEQFIEEAVEAALWIYRDKTMEINLIPGEYEGKECYVIGDKTMFGRPYKKIIVQGHVISVPTSCVK